MRINQEVKKTDLHVMTKKCKRPIGYELELHKHITRQIGFGRVPLQSTRRDKLEFPRSCYVSTNIHAGRNHAEYKSEASEASGAYKIYVARTM